jgi:hypothetical protein
MTLSALAQDATTREIMKPFDTRVDTERGYYRVHESTQGEFLCLLLKIGTDLTPISRHRIFPPSKQGYIRCPPNSPCLIYIKTYMS